MFIWVIVQVAMEELLLNKLAGWKINCLFQQSCSTDSQMAEMSLVVKSEGNQMYLSKSEGKLYFVISYRSVSTTRRN